MGCTWKDKSVQTYKYNTSSAILICSVTKDQLRLDRFPQTRPSPGCLLHPRGRVGQPE